ncbi:MAG: ribonuclease H-like domain-containing protein [Phycisphaerae bacterium]
MLVKSLSQGDFEGASDALRACASSRGAEKTKPQPLDLTEACPGCERRQERSAYWQVLRRLDEVTGGDSSIASEYSAVMRGARQRLDELNASAELCIASDLNPEDLLFMDIETCGLGGTPVFLVGTMHYAEGDLVFEQSFARHYGEEPAILSTFAQRLEQTKLLVTFNGKSFDMNQIAERAVFYGMSIDKRARPHLDLLHESRRFWRGEVPNCRLQTLEQCLFGRRRVGDIPGSAIPDAYHRFVHSGDAREVRDIMHHNLLDLLTMAQILCAMLTGQTPEL